MGLPAQPFISLDVKTLVDSLKDTRQGFNITVRAVKQALRTGMFMVMDELGDEAKALAPHRKGGLNNRWSTNIEESDNGQLVVGTCGFNIAYAHVRDVGTAHLPGGMIKPVHAKALFIPLRDGVRPGDKSLKWGVDFVLSGGVRQEGNLYWTKAVRAARRTASAKFTRALKALLGRGRTR